MSRPFSTSVELYLVAFGIASKQTYAVTRVGRNAAQRSYGTAPAAKHVGRNAAKRSYGKQRKPALHT